MGKRFYRNLGNLFTPMVVGVWNDLPGEVVETVAIQMFNLDRYVDWTGRCGHVGPKGLLPRYMTV